MLSRSKPLFAGALPAMRQRTFIPLIYYFLILFISYTFMNKLSALHSFQVNLLKTGLYSLDVAKQLSYLVLAGELGVLIALLFFKKAGSVLLFAMLTVFTLYICLLRLLGRYEVCGCGGVLNGLEFRYHLLINLGLVVLSWLLLKDSIKKNNYEN